MPIATHRYFSTPIFIADTQEPEPLNAGLLSLIRERATTQCESPPASNVPGLGGWHSALDLHLDPAFSPLTERISAAAAEAAKALHLDARAPLGLDAMWAIINPPGSYNRSHIHPRAHLSGVYYIQTPPNCGALDFTDPRTEALVNPPLVTAEAQKDPNVWSKVALAPVAGRLVLFPGWLYHAVGPNLSGAKGAAADRIIVSFNLSQRITPSLRPS